MSKLHFESGFMSPELNSLDLPVEVRKPDLTLVARGLSSQSVELAPGTYCFTAKLPAGQQLSGTVQVEEGKEETATLTPEPEVASPHEWQEVPHYILGPSDPSPQAGKQGQLPPEPENTLSGSQSFNVEPADGGGGLEPLGPESTSAKLRGFRGNVLQGECSVKDNQDWLTFMSPGTTEFNVYDVSPGDTKLVQLLQPEVPAINMVPPASQEQGCQLVLLRQP